MIDDWIIEDKSLTELMASSTPMPCTADSAFTPSAQRVTTNNNASILCLDNSLSDDLIQRKPNEPHVCPDHSRLIQLEADLVYAKLKYEKQCEEITRLNAQIDLLSGEIDRYKKTQSSQKSEIKKLANENDDLRRQLSRFNGMRRFVSDAPSFISMTQVHNEQNGLDNMREKIQVTEAKLLSLKEHVMTTASDLISALEPEGNFTKVTSKKRAGNRPKADHQQLTNRNRSPTDQQPTSSNFKTASTGQVPEVIITRTSRTSSTKQLPKQVSRDKLVVIGTSLVRGQGAALQKEGVDAICYSYPGCEIPFIRSRVSSILSPRVQPKNIHLQCGGNDASSRDAHLVVKEYDALIREVKRCCPGATITTNTIPPRGSDERVLQRIQQINTYLRNRGKRGDDVNCIDVQPDFPRHFSPDKVHFSKTGKTLYARKLADYYVNFPPLPASIHR